MLPSCRNCLPTKKKKNQLAGLLCENYHYGLYLCKCILLSEETPQVIRLLCGHIYKSQNTGTPNLNVNFLQINCQPLPRAGKLQQEVLNSHHGIIMINR